MVAVHAVWLISLWVLGHDQPLHVIALLFYLVLQVLRVWVMRTLGARWTTGVIVLPEHAGVSGTLSVSVASQLCCRGRRDRRAAAGAGVADARRHLHDP